MSYTDPTSNENQLKRYLYAELSPEDASDFEDAFFDDDRLFNRVAALENEIVDSYLANRLSADERAAFERSLKTFPARGEKLANAAALQTFIERENIAAGKLSAEPRRATFGRKALDFFRFNAPVYSYGLAGLILLLAFGNIFLLIDRRRQTVELAALQAADNADRVRDAPENQAETARRQAEFEASIDEERETAVRLTDELEREKQRRARLEQQIKRLGEQGKSTPDAAPPLIASILLVPNVLRRGGKSAEPPAIELAGATEKAVVRLVLPADTNERERFSVRLNERTIARNLAVRAADSGQKIIYTTVSRRVFTDGLNKLIAFGENGREAAQYVFYVQAK